MSDRLIRKIIEGQEIVTSTADTTVSDAALLMRDKHIGAVIVVEGGKLAGSVTGPLVDARGKAAHAARLKGELGIPRERVLAIGDGANDLLMMAEAGTSIAYHAKPVVKEKADYALDYAGLDGVLNLFPDAYGLPASRTGSGK